MRTAKSSTLLLTLVLLLAATATSHGQDAEDYKVYDAVVRAMFRDGVTQFDMNAKIKQIVIRDRTHSEYAWRPEQENWEQVKIRLRSLTDEIIADYETARKTEAELKAKFEIPFKYNFITDKQLAEIFPDKQNYDKSFEYWNAFYKLYPNSAGYNSFSRIGYDKARTKALVYFVNWCGPLCGTGSYVFVEKTGKCWDGEGSR